MKISVNKLKHFYLFLSVFYYCGFLGFFTRLLTGGRGDDLLSENASGSLYKQIVGAVLLLLGMFIIPRINSSQLIRDFRANLPLFILLSYFLASTLWSPVAGVSFRRLIALSTIFIVGYSLVRSFTPVSLLKYFAMSGVIASLIGIILAVINPEMAFSGEGERANTFTGIFYDKNSGARFYAYSFVILVGLGLYKKMHHVLALVALFLCLLMARSATALVVLISGLGLLYLFSQMHTKSITVNVKRILLLTGILIITAIVINYSYAFILSLLGRDPTLTNRQIIWELLSVYINESFTYGYGYGAFWASPVVQSFVDRWGFIGNAHSGYYEIMLYGGIVALALLLVLFAHILKNCVYLYVYLGASVVPPIILTLLILQIIVNYVAFIIINHNSSDMYLFCLVLFISSLMNGNNKKQKSNIHKL